MTAADITPRQHQILRLIADGKSSKEIATDLGLSTRTVSVHRDELYKRLNIHSVAEAVRAAYEFEVSDAVIGMALAVAFAMLNRSLR